MTVAAHEIHDENMPTPEEYKAEVKRLEAEEVAREGYGS